MPFPLAFARSLALASCVVSSGCAAPMTQGVRGRAQESSPGDDGPSGAPLGPLAWAALDASTFARAKAEHRLVVIDGSAEWCHWCHVMEATTYHDPSVRKVLDERYIAVKVDVDAHPDFEERYVAWGWPATVVMTADGEELGKYKGYLAPDDFLEILRTATEAAKPPRAAGDDPKDTEAHRATEAELRGARGAIEQELERYWDAREGGWGVGQKAPLAWENIWALSRAQNGDARQRDHALVALDRQSLLIDPVWGGMSQYSTDGDWKHPHFEKLMAVQAGAIEGYALAYRLTGDARWLSEARKVRRFVDAFLTGPDGAFLTTMDADLNAHEGPQSGKPYVAGAAYYAMSDAGRRVLGIPRVDTHAYGRENGLAIDAYLTLYDASNDPSALEAARKAASRVLATHGDPRDGLSHGALPDDDGKVRSLADNAAMGFALCHLYAATHEPQTLAAAQAIAGFLLHDLYDPRGGGFYASTPDPNAVGVFAARRKPFEHDVMAARFLERLDALTHDPRNAEAVATTLFLVTRPGAYEARGRFLGDVLLAIDESRSGGSP